MMLMVNCRAPVVGAVCDGHPVAGCQFSDFDAIELQILSFSHNEIDYSSYQFFFFLM